jgi:hypothetical protein
MAFGIALNTRDWRFANRITRVAFDFYQSEFPVLNTMLEIRYRKIVGGLP